jgi:DUF1680 family protein
MKNLFVLLLIAFLSLTPESFPQIKKDTIDLSKGWVFKTGDGADYAKSDFYDKDWKSIEVNKYWESQGYSNYDGIAWYRINVIIPSSLKQGINQVLKFSLGKIDDYDEAFLNGTRIGHTEAYFKTREYLVPFNLVNWDKENIIAVRVNDIGGNGGLYSGPYFISSSKISDIVRIITPGEMVKTDPSSNISLTGKITFKYSAPLRLTPGTLSIKIRNEKSKKLILNEIRKVNLGTGADSVIYYTFELTDGGSYKAFYCFIDSTQKDTVNSSVLIAHKTLNRPDEKRILPSVLLKIPGKIKPFSYGNIHLKGYLEDRLNANLYKRLLNIDETAILECFYNRPGTQEWVGEYAGKYLHAACRAWRYSNNIQLKKQMDRVVDILLEYQNNDGYLGTYLPNQYWTSWDVWAHKYDLLGLLSYYSITGYQPVLDACVRIGNLLCKTFGTNKGQLNIVDAGYHVGMASCSVLEPMTYLYRFTGDKKYLDFCNYIIDSYESKNGPKIISTLLSLGRVDKVANGKAYEMLSNLIGIVKLYQLTGDEKLLKAVKIAYDDIAHHRLYITGTASKDEYFQDDEIFPAENSDHMGEGCVSTSWLQFSQALFELTGEIKYIDEIEKTIYNHLLAAENPISGCVSYYTALQGLKPYNCSVEGHCCLASLPRGIAAIPELVYSRYTDGGLAVNIYSAGSARDTIVTKKGKNIVVDFSIDIKYPESNKAKIRINTQSNEVYKIALRAPVWCKSFVAIVNGKKYIRTPGRYLVLEKSWNKKSVIDIIFYRNTRLLDGGKSYAGFIAVKKGARVLAFDRTLNPEIGNLDLLKLVPGKVYLKRSATKLPDDWSGSDIYDLHALYDNQPVILRFVPFAEAGQRGGEVRVWIKKG